MEEMTEDFNRNMGEQPIAKLMAELGLKSHDLVAASEVQMTHKMVTKACKGRMLTRNVQTKVMNALNNATKGTYKLEDLFNY